MRVSGLRAVPLRQRKARGAARDTRSARAQRAHRVSERRRRAGEVEGTETESGGERPVSLARVTVRMMASRLASDLQRTREALGVLGDSEQCEAELAAVRANTQAEVSHDGRAGGRRSARADAGRRGGRER